MNLCGLRLTGAVTDAAILLRSLADQLSRLCGAVVVSAPAAIVLACVERDCELRGRAARRRMTDSRKNHRRT
jgi:hypothetical protein